MKIKVLKIRIADEFLREDQREIDHFLKRHEIIKTETAFVHDEQFWSVVLYFNDIESAVNKTIVKDSKAVKYSADDEMLNEDEGKILDALKLWRSEKAKEQNLPTYFIATNKELVSVAKYKPAKKKSCSTSKVSENIRLKTTAKRF